MFYYVKSRCYIQEYGGGGYGLPFREMQGKPVMVWRKRTVATRAKEVADCRSIGIRDASGQSHR